MQICPWDVEGKFSMIFSITPHVRDPGPIRRWVHCPGGDNSYTSPGLSIRAFRLWRGQCQLVVGHTTASSSHPNVPLQGSALPLASLPRQTYERIIPHIPVWGSVTVTVFVEEAGEGYVDEKNSCLIFSYSFNRTFVQLENACLLSTQFFTYITEHSYAIWNCIMYDLTNKRKLNMDLLFFKVALY